MVWKMKYFLSILFFKISLIAAAQEYRNFSWNDKEVEFASVEMKVEDTKTNQLIFKGYKDGYIKIRPIGDDPKLGFISLKLSGYFQIEEAIISRFRYEIDEKWISIEYTCEDGNKMAFVILNYKIGEKKPSFIIVSTVADYTTKNSKRLSFTLTSLE
jgi:hypothetical protein